MKKIAVLSLTAGLLLVGCTASTTNTQVDDTDAMMASSESSIDAMEGAMTWGVAMDGTWQDYNDKWHKLVDGKLMISADGTTWTEVTAGTFKATDGKWYRWNAEGKLEWSTDGETWAMVDTGEWPGKGGATYKMDADGKLWIMEADDAMMMDDDAMMESSEGAMMEASAGAAL